jgi:hypothetical protein
MDELQREKIANQRFQLIAPLVNHTKDLPRGERYAILRLIAEGKHPHVQLPSGRIGLRTLERYLHLYEKGGIEALKPKLRERAASIPKEYLDMACSLRRENMTRSIERIISMLEESGVMFFTRYNQKHCKQQQIGTKDHVLNLITPTGFCICIRISLHKINRQGWYSPDGFVS